MLVLHVDSVQNLVTNTFPFAETNTLCFKTQAMQQGAESEPVQAYLSEFLSLAEFLSLTCLPPWVAKEKIGTLLLASEIPVPIQLTRTVVMAPLLS